MSPMNTSRLFSIRIFLSIISTFSYSKIFNFINILIISYLLSIKEIACSFHYYLCCASYSKGSWTGFHLYGINIVIAGHHISFLVNSLLKSFDSELFEITFICLPNSFQLHPKYCYHTNMTLFIPKLSFSFLTLLY
jgi:hypothetical protein